MKEEFYDRKYWRTKKFKRTSFNPKTEIIPVGFDTVFKKIFGSGDNNKYIRYLLKKILKIEHRR